MTRPTADMPAGPDPVQFMRETFRQHLERFYTTLKLAPPYHSVEKAILELTKSLHALPLDERRRLVGDQQGQWDQFKKAFVVSGLNQKHRGILTGFARQRETLSLPPEYHCLLDTFLHTAP